MERLVWRTLIMDLQLSRVHRRDQVSFVQLEQTSMSNNE